MYSTKFLNAQHFIFRSTGKEISITICHVSHAEGVIDVIFTLHPSLISNTSPRSKNSRRSLARPVSLLASEFSTSFKMSTHLCRICSMYGSVGDFFPFRISVMILFQPYRSLMLFTAQCNLAFLLYFLGIFAMSHTNFDIVFPCTLNHETRQISVGDMFFTV